MTKKKSKTKKTKKAGEKIKAKKRAVKKLTKVAKKVGTRKLLKKASPKKTSNKNDKPKTARKPRKKAVKEVIIDVVPPQKVDVVVKKPLTSKELEAEADKLLAETTTTPQDSSNYYFGEVEERGFLEFIASNEKHERDILYNRHLKEPFQKMVESILRRWPVHMGNYDIKEVEQNCLSHLIENMHKFKPDTIGKNGKKVKAFSYLQTIVRNYFRDHGKKSYAEKTSNLNYDDYSSEIENMDEFLYEIDRSEDLELQELLTITIDKLKERLANDKSLRKNEYIVGDAILSLLEHWDVLFQEETKHGKYNKRVTNNFTKNKVLLLLKEQTRLSTKDIRASMKQFKELYFVNKQLYFNEQQDSD